MALDALFSRVPLERAHFHAIPAERGARMAALDYAAVIKPVPAFDLVMLGLGEDGHTASLFPGADIGTAMDASDVLPVEDAPKPPSERVSLSAARLSRAHNVMFVVSGQSKRDAVRRWRRSDDLPAAHIAPAAGVDGCTHAVRGRRLPQREIVEAVEHGRAGRLRGGRTGRDERQAREDDDANASRDIAQAHRHAFTLPAIRPCT